LLSCTLLHDFPASFWATVGFFGFLRVSMLDVSLGNKPHLPVFKGPSDRCPPGPGPFLEHLFVTVEPQTPSDYLLEPVLPDVGLSRYAFFKKLRLLSEEPSLPKRTRQTLIFFPLYLVLSSFGTQKSPSSGGCPLYSSPFFGMVFCRPFFPDTCLSSGVTT